MRGFLDWVFRDRKTGAIVIGQWPNAPLWLFAAFAGLAWAVPAWAPAERAETVLWFLAAVSLAWWALAELIRGVNPWRRFLGGCVLVFGFWRLSPRL